MEDEIYQANILDHNRHPHHYGRIPGATAVDGKNPSCGDALSLTIAAQDGAIVDARFEGDGCAISRAATSMLLDRVVGMKTADALALGAKDMRALMGIPIGESRERCMMLGLETLKEALDRHA